MVASGHQLVGDVSRHSRRSRLSAAGGRSISALRVRNFRNYFIGQFLSTVGNGMQMLALTWLVLDLTHSAARLGLLITLQTLPVLLLGTWAGSVADRVDNRLVVTVTSLGAATGAAALGVLVATDHATMLNIAVVAVALGTANAFERPASQALLYELVGPDDIPSAIGLSGTLNATTRLVGPAVAGLLLATVGMEACFYANAVSFLPIVVVIARLRSDELLPRRAAHGAVRIRDGLSYAWRDPVLRRGLIGMALAGTFTYNFAQSVPSMVRFVFHAGPGALGIAQAVGGLGSVIGGLVIAALRRPTCRIVGACAVGFGLLIATTAFSPNMLTFTILWLPTGLGSAVYLSSTQALLQRRAAPEFQGRIMALFSIAWIGTTPIGATVQGYIIDTWSARVGLGFGASASLLAGAYLLVARPDHTADTTAS